MIKQFILALVVTSVLAVVFAFGLAARERDARSRADGKVWQLEGERDTYKQNAEALADQLADLRATPPVVCPEPEKPVKKKAEKRVVPVFGKW